MTALPDPPSEAETHLVADWIELACLLDADGQFSGVRFAQARGEDEQFQAAREDDVGRDDTPERADARMDEAQAVWRLLRRRAVDFGDGYPFDVDSDETSLQTRTPTRTRKVYAFLLVAASLNVFGEHAKLLTESFERTSRHVVAALLPLASRTDVFGTAAPAGGRYQQGNTITRLSLLAEDLGSKLLDPANKVSPRASGDGGLDIVGRPLLSGPKTRLPVLFAQCACGKDWLKKQAEVAPTRWSTRLEPTVPIMPVTIIPYAFQDEQGAWHREFEIDNGVLIDRLRWMALLANRDDDAYADVPFSLVDARLPGLQAAA